MRTNGQKLNGANKVGRFSVDLELANYEDIVLARDGKISPDKIRRLVISGVVDSAATKLFLPTAVAKQLGLLPSDDLLVTYGDGRRAARKQAAGVYATLQGRGGLYAAVLEPKRTTALIGAVILEDLDLLIDCKRQKLYPRDPKFMTAEVG